MAFYAVIDTNVLVSALLTKHENASPLQVVLGVFQGKIIPLFDAEILKEYNDVLRRPKFHFSEELIVRLMDSLMTLGLSIERITTNATFVDPKDLVFYEVAMAGREDDAYLVTGNKKHFPLETFIVTPGEMLGIMNLSK